MCIYYYSKKRCCQRNYSDLEQNLSSNATLMPFCCEITLSKPLSKRAIAIQSTLRMDKSTLNDDVCRLTLKASLKLWFRLAKNFLRHLASRKVL